MNTELENTNLTSNDAKPVLAEVHNPLTEQEQEVMELIVKAHNKFIELDRGHSMEVQEWVIAIHSLQSIISHRCLRRQFPKYFR